MTTNRCCVAPRRIVHSLLLGTTVSFFATDHVLAQVSWSGRLSQLTKPPVSAGFAMAATDDGVVLLFGGVNTAGALSNQTWIYSPTTQTWAQALPPASPTARQGHAMTYDPINNYIVLFGGRGGAGGNVVMNDTWVFSLSNFSWSQMTITGATPLPTVDHNMVFDRSLGRVLVFGGFQNIFNGGLLGQGMSLLVNPSTPLTGLWVSGAAIPQPAGRVRHAMCYDRVRGRTIMFGGEIPSPSVLAPTNQLFEFDALGAGGIGVWSLVVPAGPAILPTSGPEMTYDAARGLTVIFGNRNAPTSAPTMEYDGTAITSRVPVPSLRPVGHGFVYDAASRRCVFYGGDVANETREYAPVPTSLARRFGGTTFGTGAFCTFSTNRLPDLGTQNGREWQLGTTANVRVANLPPQLEAAFLMSAFNEAVPPIAVPGAPGCFQLITNGVQTFPMIQTQGNPEFLVPITIPNSPGFLGFPFFLQCLVTDANSARGFAVSNALEVRAGGS